MKRLIALASTLIVFGLALAGCQGNEEKNPGAPNVPVGDKTLTDTVTVNVTNSVPGSLNLTVGTPVDE